MANPAVSNLAPIAVEQGHTLFREDRDRVFNETGCSVAVRQRGKWASRMLTVSGPPEKLIQVAFAVWEWVACPHIVLGDKQHHGLKGQTCTPPMASW